MSIRGFFLLSMCLANFGAVSLRSSPVFAYASSQEAQWEADIKEAKARAKDFEKHLERQRAADRARESAAQEIKKERARDEARLERMREEFIVERTRKPDPSVVERKMELEHEKQLQAEARAYEALRLKFVNGQDRVEKQMRKEAFIDPAREYNVRSARSIEEINKDPLERPLLKFDVKKGSDSPR